MEFTVTAHNGDSVRVESDNWMQAVGKALGFFNIDIETVDALRCARQDGVMHVEVPGAEPQSWVIRASESNVPVQASERSEREQWKPLAAEPTASDIDPNAPRPDIVMPEASLKVDDPQTLGERLFDLSMEIDSLSTEAAADQALKIAVAATRAGAGMVALGTLDQVGLTVVAAAGQGADGFRERVISFGEGLVGMCFDMSDVIAVPDVDGSTPHVDAFPGEPVVAALCVPLVDDNETVRGVVQLLNPGARPFVQADVDAAVLVSRTLARALAVR